MDLNKHKFFMLQILRDIYSDLELASSLGFKGGTALMFFYGLPRFSVDLDFNLLKPEMESKAYQKVKNILLKYGAIADEAQKFFGPILVLSYGKGERNLKVEISNRQYDNRYEVKTFMGIPINVLVAADMFAHKLCALLDRSELANRDIFDCWFFMEKRTPVNKGLVESRMQTPFADYLQSCIDRLASLPDKRLLNGLGELLQPDMKTFVRNRLRTELLALLRFYKDFPIAENG
ncbi:MAG: nucleotidyl transferase AbiEii/AbiGii toxin family protein [Prevotellaceae bacterium]|jgi:predicted nucleotidyltransferase component of viral defense system|nr:nucleotidyl transferase AbiEii/AbiGii toxin family protein [Prevotellaceae bacterium]